MRSTARAAPTVYPRAQRILERHIDQVVKGLKPIHTERKLTGSKAKTLLDAAGLIDQQADLLERAGTLMHDPLTVFRSAGDDAIAENQQSRSRPTSTSGSRLSRPSIDPRT